MRVTKILLVCQESQPHSGQLKSGALCVHGFHARLLRFSYFVACYCLTWRASAKIHSRQAKTKFKWIKAQYQRVIPSMGGVRGGLRTQNGVIILTYDLYE